MSHPKKTWKIIENYDYFLIIRMRFSILEPQNRKKNSGGETPPDPPAPTISIIIYYTRGGGTDHYFSHTRKFNYRLYKVARIFKKTVRRRLPIAILAPPLRRNRVYRLGGAARRRARGGAAVHTSAPKSWGASSPDFGS